MKRRSLIYLLFAAIRAINIAIYFYKDHFQYQPYSTYKELYSECDNACRNKWSRYLKNYPPDELRKAKKILRDSAHLSPDAPQTEKIKTIANFLHSFFQKHYGTPTIEFQMQSPLTQYAALCENEGKIWCGNAANLFAFFCWAEGIATRNIEIMKPGDHHVMNECYLEKEKNGYWLTRIYIFTYCRIATKII